MTDFLFYAKIVLLVVLLYDVGILFRKPEEGSKVAKLDFWTEMERKGINALLIPSTMVFIICLDIVQQVDIYLSLISLTPNHVGQVSCCSPRSSRKVPSPLPRPGYS